MWDQSSDLLTPVTSYAEESAEAERFAELSNKTVSQVAVSKARPKFTHPLSMVTRQQEFQW